MDDFLFIFFFPVSNCSYDVGATTGTNLCHAGHTSGPKKSLRAPETASERGTLTPSGLPENTSINHTPESLLKDNPCTGKDEYLHA